MKWYSFDEKLPKKNKSNNEDFVTSVVVLCVGSSGVCLGYYDYDEETWRPYNDDCVEMFDDCDHWTYFNSYPECYEGMFKVDFF